MVFFSNLRRSKSDARSASGYSSQTQFPVQATSYPAPRSVLRRSDKRHESRQTITRASSDSLPSPASDVSLPPEYTDLDVDTSRYPTRPAQRAHAPPSSHVSGPGVQPRRQEIPRQINPHPHTNGSQAPSLPPVPVLTSMLAVGSVSIIWDVRDSPVHMRQPRQSRQANDLSVPATSTHSQRLCIISHEFPWSIDVAAKKSRPLTALDIVEALYESLDRELRRSEWALASDGQKYAMQKANKVRRQAESAKRIRRVDWLGSRYMFRGMERDDTLARKRLMPGDRTDSETWVVRFGSQT